MDNNDGVFKNDIQSVLESFKPFIGYIHLCKGKANIAKYSGLLQVCI